MERAAQRNVTIVRTTLLVGYTMENVMILGVLTLYTSLRFVKVNLYITIYINTSDGLKPH